MSLLHKFKYDIPSLVSKVYIQAVGEIKSLPSYLASAGNKQDAIAIFVPGWRNKHLSHGAIWVRAYMDALQQKNLDVKIVSSPSELTPGQKVIWRPSEKWVGKHLRYSSNVSRVLVQMAHAIEKQGGQLFPNSETIACYENKISMHEMFNRVGLRSPISFIVCSYDEYNNAISKLGFPLIVKGAYGYSSSHVLLMENEEQAVKFGNDLFPNASSATRETYKKNSFIPPVIVQEYLNIRQDVRVVFIGHHIFISYRRINQSRNWKPTATHFGSRVVYESFPAQWVDFLTDAINKIQFPWGGFDIAWKHDDFSTEPYVLEVSPCFEPNPPPRLGFEDDYYKYKYYSKFNYNLDLWRIIQKVAESQIAYLLSVG